MLVTILVTGRQVLFTTLFDRWATVRIKYRRIKTSRYVNKERLRELRFVHISAKVEMGLLFVANVKEIKAINFRSAMRFPSSLTWIETHFVLTDHERRVLQECWLLYWTKDFLQQSSGGW